MHRGPSLSTVSSVRSSLLPTVVLTPRGAARVRDGEPWVSRADVASLPTGGAAVDEGAGDVVRLSDPRGKVLGTGLYSAKAPVAVRVWDKGGDPLSREELAARCAAARDLRRMVAQGAEAFRLVHAEADRLPGLIVDRYGDALVVQTLCPAMDRRLPFLTEVLRELVAPRLIVLRNDGSARDFEGLPRTKELLWGSGPTTVTYREGDVRFTVDLLLDAKTGAFLDQRENHLVARRYARGRGLDVFTYHGGFALHLARACDSVFAVDESQAAIERALANLKGNGLSNVRFQVADAFQELARLDAAGEQFDTVVLDPPALAKRRTSPAMALRAYRDLNVRGLRLTRPGGILVTCSCSGQISREDFEAMLVRAASNVRRTIQILERRGAAADHPVLLGLPSTEYLKCFVLRVL